MAAGVASAAWGVSRFFAAAEVSAIYALAFVVAGALEVLLCWGTLARNRMAWAFALSLNGTAAVIFLLGVPQVRNGLGVHIAVAVLPSVAFAVITTLLIGGADQFEGE